MPRIGPLADTPAPSCHPHLARDMPAPGTAAWPGAARDDSSDRPPTRSPRYQKPNIQGRGGIEPPRPVLLATSCRLGAAASPARQGHDRARSADPNNDRSGHPPQQALRMRPAPPGQGDPRIPPRRGRGLQSAGAGQAGSDRSIFLAGTRFYPVFTPQAHQPAPHQLVSGEPASSKRRQRFAPRFRAAT